MIEEPPLLILDEPFSNLDNISKFEFKDILKKIVQQLKISLLFVTHDSKDALTFSDDIIILQNGKIIQEGKPKEIATKPTNEYAAKLIGLTNIISGKEISPFAMFDVNKNKNYWVPFNGISVIETGALRPIKIDFLGDETIAHVKLNNVLIQVKSFNNFPVTFGIEISNAIML